MRGHGLHCVCAACREELAGREMASLEAMPVSRMTERQKRIVWLDAQVFALRGCKDRRAERERLWSEYRTLRAMERAS